MPLAKTDATPAPAIATARTRMRWEWVAHTERETEERRTSRREPRTTWPGATWRTKNFWSPVMKRVLTQMESGITRARLAAKVR